MSFNFHKYHGTGNDFILIDNRDKKLRLSTSEISRACNRHFGIGADGLMLLEEATGYDFRMVYYNSDGNESSMCGNGGRCLAAFAKKLGIVNRTARFIATDGIHNAMLDEDGTISLQMQDVGSIQRFPNYSILNTGSPHYVVWRDNVKEIDVVREGRSIRNRDEFLPDGINVNFVQKLKDGLFVRTYERGVEDETLSCGTGVTACAIATADETGGRITTIIYTPGGILEVSFEQMGSSAIDVILRGPAQLVFEGDYEPDQEPNGLYLPILT